MRTSRSSVVTPLPVRHALRKLGRDIRDARRRRRIPAAIAAQRASISRTTLVKVEKGDPGVAIGIYATVLFVLAWRTGWAISPRRRTIPWACNSKKKTCPSAFEWRTERNARKTSDGQRGSRIRGSRRRPAPDGASVGRTRKNKESATFEYDKTWLEILRDSLWSQPCRLVPARFTRPQTRQCSAPSATPRPTVGAGAHAPHGT